MALTNFHASFMETFTGTAHVECCDKCGQPRQLRRMWLSSFLGSWRTCFRQYMQLCPNCWFNAMLHRKVANRCAPEHLQLPLVPFAAAEPTEVY